MRYLAAVLVILSSSCGAFAQQSPAKPKTPPWTVLTDPVCPVASFYGTPLPNASKELKVMYFPLGKTAKLHDPQSLDLHIGFNQPGRGSSATAIPFTHTDDHWEATVPLSEPHAMYAIFLVQDPKTGAIDDNGGQLWDLVFCGAQGSKDANSVMAQARGYAGESWTASLRRPKDYDKAISILKAGLDQKPANNSWWMPELWKTEARRDGNDAQAWAKIAGEIDGFASDHRDKRDLYWMGHFVIEHPEQLPADFVDRFIAAADAQLDDPKKTLREQLEYNRAVFLRDPKKGVAAFDAFVAKYPDGELNGFAQANRLVELIALKDIAGAEAALAAYREAQKSETRRFRDPNGYSSLLQLARLYIEKKIKLDQALKLIDEAQAWPQSDTGGVAHPLFRRQIEALSRLARARAYLALNQPAQALEEIQKSIEIGKYPDSGFVLAQALAANGKKKEALEAYFEAALRPSNNDLEYTAALEQFYVKEHFGNRRQFAAALEARQAERFKASAYKPEIVDQAAPEVEFVTLAGEAFNAEKLAGKTVVVNFWSPG
jgi:tetratricopeptide (TPR) repeat protein